MDVSRQWCLVVPQFCFVAKKRVAMSCGLPRGQELAAGPRAARTFVKVDGPDRPQTVPREKARETESCIMNDIHASS